MECVVRRTFTAKVCMSGRARRGAATGTKPGASQSPNLETCSAASLSPALVLCSWEGTLVLRRFSGLLLGSLFALAACAPSSSVGPFAAGTQGALHGEGLLASPDAAKFKQFNVPTPSSEPYKIVLGPNGAFWFTEFAGNKIAEITTAGKITEFTVPTSSSKPDGITVGPENNLWFAEGAGEKIVKMTTAGK